MLKAYTARLYPNKTQAEFFEVCFDGVRFVYNWMLEYRIKEYERYKNGEIKKTSSDYDLIKLLPGLKKQHPWLTKPSGRCLQIAVLNLGAAYKHFFRRVKSGEKPGFPKFKSRHGRQSCQFIETTAADFDNCRFKFPKIGWVKCRGLKRFDGKIKRATVSRGQSGKYHLSVLVDDGLQEPEPAPIIEERDILALDTNITYFAATSDGRLIENPRFYRRQMKRLRRAQRKLSRRQKGSKRREKQRRVVARLHERIANQRNDFLHQLSSRLSNSHIAVEDHAVQDMMQRAGTEKPKRHAKNITRGFSDTANFEFRRQLEYKCRWKGARFIVVPTELATNRTCRHCGHVNPEKVAASDFYVCHGCGTRIFRYENSPLVIRRLAYHTVRNL